MASARELRDYERRLERATRRLEKRVERIYRDAYNAAMRERLDPEMLREAIKLTHPDRHPPERQEQAARVTAWLISLRR